MRPSAVVGVACIVFVASAGSLVVGADEHPPRADGAPLTVYQGSVGVDGGHAWGPDRLIVDGGPRWRLTGSMAFPRISHSATVLPSGLVLVAGGVPYLLQRGMKGGGCCPDFCAPALDGGVVWGATSKAELYDPVSGSWTPTGEMQRPRARHAAFLIKSGPHAGKVFVVGGCSGFGYVWASEPDEYFHCFAPLRSTELYNPSTAAWEPGPELLHAPGYSNVIALADGRLLAAGTLDDPVSWCPGISAHPGAESQILDPAAGDPKWELAAPMNRARVHQSMVLLDNGEVLAIGGIENWGPDGISSAAERYVPNEGDGGTWRMAAQPPAKRFREVLVRLDGGNILRTGACGSASPCCVGSIPPPTGEAWIYEPTTNLWRKTASMRCPRVYPSSVVLDSGKVLVAGGDWRATSSGHADYYPCTFPEIFDPVTETWSPTNLMPRYVMGGGAMVKLPSGAALFTGGYVNGAGYANGPAENGTADDMAYSGSSSAQVYR